MTWCYPQETYSPHFLLFEAKYSCNITLVQNSFLKKLYFGQQKESVKKEEGQPGSEIWQNLSKLLIISTGNDKISG